MYCIHSNFNFENTFKNFCLGDEMMSLRSKKVSRDISEEYRLGGIKLIKKKKNKAEKYNKFYELEEDIDLEFKPFWEEVKNKENSGS